MIWEKKRSFGFRPGMDPSDDNFDREVVNSILLLSGLLGGYTDVILDGANIIHGGSNGSGMNGRRLVSAINYYEDKGYTVHAVLKQETFNYMRKQKTNGFEDIDKLIEDPFPVVSLLYKAAMIACDENIPPERSARGIPVLTGGLSGSPVIAIYPVID